MTYRRYLTMHITSDSSNKQLVLMGASPLLPKSRSMHIKLGLAVLTNYHFTNSILTFQKVLRHKTKLGSELQ